MRLGLVLTLLLVLLAPGCSGGGDDDAARPADDQVLRWGIVGEGAPESTAWDDLTDLPINTPWNLFDPLVKVDDDLEAVPNVAERWDWSDGGHTITFHLRRDGRWTNGDPLTAHDYVYGWRQALSEGRPSEHAGLHSIIVGAKAFVACDPDERECEALWDGVGVRALDDYTLEVRLTEPQPWFPELLGGFACVCFGALHRETVERFGDDWAQPQHIVTSGPFKLARWSRNESLVLVKDEQWRDAASVALDRVEIRIFRKDADAVRAFEAGELHVTDAEGGAADHRVAYPSLATRYIGLDVEDIPDRKQRHAMALALDQGEIARKMLPAGEARPATSLTTDGVPGFGRVASDFLRIEARLADARRLMAAAENPRRAIKLWTWDPKQWLVAAHEIRRAWLRLGIETTIAAVPTVEYVRLLQDRELEDAHLFGFAYDAPNAGEFLDSWRCGHLWNFGGFCDPAYDRLLDRAARHSDEEGRLRLYAAAEAMLTGPDGAMPAIPLSWGSRTMLEQPSVRDTFELNKAGQVDLTKVTVSPR